MAAIDSLNIVRLRLGERIAEIEERVSRLKPVDICAKMEAIRTLAAEHGMAALEGLADYGAHHALMPGHVAATRACLEHMGDAMISDGGVHDRESILAALAIRLHSEPRAISCIEGACEPSPSCSTTWSTPGHAIRS